MLAPELFEALSQLCHIIETAVVGYSHHCWGRSPLADASRFRSLQSRTLTANSQFKTAAASETAQNQTAAPVVEA
ncbi:MAG TPA: hypothetical protein VGF01_01500, partial [Terracidiphilus sp.]